MRKRRVKETPRFWPKQFEEWSCHLVKWERWRSRLNGKRFNFGDDKFERPINTWKYEEGRYVSLEFRRKAQAGYVNFGDDSM